MAVQGIVKDRLLSTAVGDLGIAKRYVAAVAHTTLKKYPFGRRVARGKARLLDRDRPRRQQGALDPDLPARVGQGQVERPLQAEPGEVQTANDPRDPLAGDEVHLLGLAERAARRAVGGRHRDDHLVGAAGARLSVHAEADGYGGAAHVERLLGTAVCGTGRCDGGQRKRQSEHEEFHLLPCNDSARAKVLLLPGIVKEVLPPIDLIALDLDGTLLDQNDGISPANRQAIRTALESGIRIVLVTGRGADAPARIVRELNLNLPAICAHGALTKDFLSGKTLGHIPVPLVHAFPMIEYAEQNRLNVAVYFEETFHRLEGTQLYMEDMLGPHWCEVDSLRASVLGPPTFVRFLGRESVEAMREAFSDLPLHFKYEVWGEFEECAVTSLEATKKNALERLCRDLEIPAERVLAIGDSRNDVPMLRWAGIGVAMGNSRSEVKENVRYVTASNDEDGVALALDRLLPRGPQQKPA